MYITNYNLNRLLTKVSANEADIKQLLNILFNDFLDNDFTRFFNIYELRRLAGTRKLFESTTGINLSGLSTLNIQPIESNNDKRFINPNKAPPAYHKDCTCTKLNSDYTELAIPNEIQQIANKHRQEIIELYRSIYKKPCGTAFLFGDKDIDWQVYANTFRSEVLSKYGIAINESTLLKPKEITLKNSKPTELPDNPKKTINECLELLHNFSQQILKNKIYQDVYNWRYLYPKKRQEFAQIRGNEYIKINAELDQLQTELYEAIINYLKIKTEFNQENLDEQLLINCGFTHCRTCCK